MRSVSQACHWLMTCSQPAPRSRPLPFTRAVPQTRSRSIPPWLLSTYYVSSLLFPPPCAA